MSLRCVNTKNYKEDYDFHDSFHFYIDHRRNEIKLHFQENINKAKEQRAPITIVSQKEYFSNMSKSYDEFYKLLDDKLRCELKSEKYAYIN